MRNAFLTGLTLVLLGTIAAAQTPEDAQKKLLSKRAAEADAYRKLAETVYGLQLNSRTYVKDFVTESDTIRGEVDSFIRGIRLGQPTWYDDGSCEVPAEVTVAKVIETLREVHKRSYKGNDIKAEDFESFARRIEKNVIKVVGMGAPREDLPPDLPQGVLQQLGGPQRADPRPAIPEIWRKVGPQARLMALEAARKDAQRKLAERIKGLRLTSRTQVRDFVTESDVITAELSASLVGAHEVTQYLHSDELIAEVTYTVPTEQVITTIKELHAHHYKGDDIKAMDIEKIVKTVIQRDFEATGMGVPPPDKVRRYAETAQVQMPDWCALAIEAKGEGTDPEAESPQGRLRAARAAEMDARRKLAERIAGLQLDATTRVEDFTTKHDEITGLVNAVIVDAVVVDTKFADQTATVTVRVPGMSVWAVVHQEMRRSSRH